MSTMSEEVLATEGDLSSTLTARVVVGVPPSDPPESADAEPDDVTPPFVDDVGIDEKFFSEGDLSHHDHGATEADALTVVDNASRKTEPYVIQRRARFARSVMWVVVGAVLVCVTAIARTAMLPKTPVPAEAKRSVTAKPE